MMGAHVEQGVEDEDVVGSGHHSPGSFDLLQISQ